MKKYAFLLILLFYINCTLFSFDFIDDFFHVFEDENDNFTANIGFGTMFPVDSDANVGENILGSIILSTISAGIGYHLNIVKNIFSPGIYADLHIGLLSLLYYDSDFTKEDQNGFFFFQTGIRLYNQFRLRFVDIQPFFGLNLIFGFEDGMGLFKYGILVSYKNFGIEYSYQFESFDYKGYDINRIVFVYHMR